jgi:fructosamine-3-kinase
MWNAIAKQLSDTLQFDFNIIERMRVSGGDINENYQISDGEQRYFVKINASENLAMFESEQENLTKLRNTRTVLVPEFITLGKTRGNAFIILNYLPTKPLSESPNSFEFGQQLAKLHQIHTQLEYGFDNDNHIGTTVQPNRWHKKWAQFFTDQRIAWQLSLLSEKGITLAQDNDALLDSVYYGLKNHNPSPSLLHGDLWNGNVANGPFGPLCFDPASYYGDRECDIAMTELFGGFDSDFYNGYQSVYPLSDGYKHRKSIYNLYHVLNHCNLFGGHYLVQAEQVIDELLLSYS